MTLLTMNSPTVCRSKSTPCVCWNSDCSPSTYMVLLFALHTPRCYEVLVHSAPDVALSPPRRGTTSNRCLTDRRSIDRRLTDRGLTEPPSHPSPINLLVGSVGVLVHPQEASVRPVSIRLAGLRLLTDSLADFLGAIRVVLLPYKSPDSHKTRPTGRPWADDSRSVTPFDPA